MANITVTHTFVNGTTADATEVNTNFNDIINGTSDGTKDFSISALTVAGTANLNGAANLNGNTTLGNATGDTITFTGRVASDIDPDTTASYSFGSTTLTYKDLYLDNGATDGGAIYFNAVNTAFIKSDASAGDLDISGFTNLDINSLNITQAGSITATGTLTNTGASSLDGAVTINESGAAVDFRVEGDTDTNLFFCDASADSVAIGHASPDSKLHVEGSTTGSLAIRVKNTNTSANTYGGFEIEATNGVVSELYVNSSNATQAIGDAHDMVLMHSQNENLILGTNDVARMTLNATGVGIGTSSLSTYDSRANKTVIEGSGDVGMTIACGATSDARLQFCHTGATGLDDGFVHYDLSNGFMYIGTGGNNAITIDSSQYVGINNPTPSYLLDVYKNTASEYIAHFSQDDATGYGVLIDTDSVSSGDPVIETLSGVGNVFRVDGNGTVSMNVTNWGSSSTQDVGISGTTGFSTLQKFTSSRRYKDNIKPYTFDTSKIYQLVGKEFVWKESGEWDFGAIAEEVEAVLPELVNYRLKHIDNDPEKPLECELDEDGNKMVESIKYRQFTFVLLEEMKKLKSKIDALEAKLAG